jgi:hypothetical protein
MRMGAVGVRPALSTPITASAVWDGFCAIGTICAVFCVLVLTHKNWQTPGSAGREMRPSPFAPMAGQHPRCELPSTVVDTRLTAAAGHAPQRPIFARVGRIVENGRRKRDVPTAKMAAGRKTGPLEGG